MTTAVLLVLFGALSRLLPHPPNAVALGALALYAGARLPRRLRARRPALRRWRCRTSSSTSAPGAPGVHRSCAPPTTPRSPRSSWLGRVARRERRRPARGSRALSVGGSVLFFLVEQLRRVARSDRSLREDAGGPRALPRRRDPLLLEHASRRISLGTAVLFGLDALSRRGGRRGGAASRPSRPPRCSCPRAAPRSRPPPVSETVVVTATSTPRTRRTWARRSRSSREIRSRRAGRPRCSSSCAPCPGSTSSSRARRAPRPRSSRGARTRRRRSCSWTACG